MTYQDDTYSHTLFERFFFEKNLQGDIVAVYNEFGEKIGSYYYDAWGNHTVVTESGNNSFEDEIVNNYNPFRYRGYYYDIETGFYYLQSRYYNPEWGRFLNADRYLNANDGIIGYNMYAYCNNTPVMYADFGGDIFGIIIAIGVGAGLIIGAYLCPTTDQINADAERHYSRNEKNKVDLSPEEIIGSYDKQKETMDEYHEYTTGDQGEDAKYNNKYLSPNGGHKEVIICEPPGRNPYIVDENIDPLNMGTYNYASNQDNPVVYGINHFFRDMIPYYLYGNTRNDSKGWLKWALN